MVYHLYHLYRQFQKGPLGLHPPRGPFQNWYKRYKWYAGGMPTASCAPIGLASALPQHCMLQASGCVLATDLARCPVPFM